MSISLYLSGTFCIQLIIYRILLPGTINDLLTDETSKGNINIISSEKYHAMSTEIVTKI